MSHDDFPTDETAVVTCGLPYANGDLHIGHLRGNIGADVYARALRRLGQRTAYVCGSDMHGTPIAVNADKEGVDPEEFALRYHEQYKETFDGFDVDFQNYGHTREPSNVELTQDIVRTLEDGGHIVEKEIQVAWDPIEDQPLPDRYVEGTCPYCGEKARGDECDEGCGRHLEPGEVEDPTSVITGNPAEYRERAHKFFRLSDFQEYLQEFIDRLEGTDNARNQPREWIEGELKDWCITRDLDWGIDYPDEEVDLVLYVWVDAPIEYIASTKDYSERVGREEYDWESVWKDEGGEIVHVIGPDIIQHHTVFWPAMLKGAGYNEPRAVMASGFVTLRGKGFSTSRNRAVWAEEYLDEGFDPDLLRFYLATNSGFQQDLDFSWGRFQERVNSELVGTLGNFVYRSLLFAHREYEGTPEVDVSDDVAHRIESAIDDFAAGINDYSVRKAGNAAIELARFGNEYIQRNEPWKLTDESPEEAAQVIRDCVQVAKAIAVLFQPIAPGTAQRLWEQLGESGDVAETTLDAALESPPASFDAPAELFEKIEDDHVAELNERLEVRSAEAEDDESDGSDDDADDGDETEAGADDHEDLEPLVDERISFDEFQGLDLRVGEIVSADPIEGADKLLRLEVDIGHEVRQIVAGLAQLHDADSLPGTRVVVVANLERAELFGVESNGMVLAAGDDADLLTTHGDAPVGTKVR
ncbi:methionine--tRNA ligase [Halomarina litorea]|uniref:methionine--tRNA ligase n=1 Tax=Halomarina litorea TaxID=2961595 RepID=UPI0020C411E0|nr:methionine--tRNA ligase [Halomarina sp. BCD28]